MDKIKVNLKNLTDDERLQLMYLIEKANNPKSKVWKPENGDDCFFLAGDGSVNKCSYGEYNFNKEYYKHGNVFKSEEDAKEEAKRRMVLTQWQRLSVESGEDEHPWNGKEYHFYCYYKYDSKEISYYWDIGEKRESVYFATSDSIINAVKEIGEDVVKKYVLCVSD